MAFTLSAVLRHSSPVHKEKNPNGGFFPSLESQMEGCEQAGGGMGGCG